MNASHSIKDPVLERQGKRMIGPAIRFVAIAVTMAVVGIVLIVFGWSLAIGIALLLLASVPGAVGFGLFTGGSIARWAARHRLFA
jgi:hypothetical protein